MSIFESIILGLVQGLTEFLPVSSSGHLAAAELMGLGGGEADIAFNIVLHLGTLAAIFTALRRDIREVLTTERRLIMPLFISTAVTAAIAIPLEKVIDKSFQSAIMIACGFAVTAVLIVLGEIVYRKTQQKKSTVSVRMSVLIGGLQGIAVFPGVSRSGTTISAGFFAGLDRDKAVRYAFFLAIPAILGAVVLKIDDITGFRNIPALCAGFAAAFISGYAALALLFRIIRTRYYLVFAGYTFVLAVGMLIYGLMHGR